MYLDVYKQNHPIVVRKLFTLIAKYINSKARSFVGTIDYTKRTYPI